MRQRLALVGLVIMVGWLAGCSAGAPAFTNLAMLERPSSPNTYLVCPAARTAATVDAEPPTYAVAVERLTEIWLQALQDEPRTTLIAAEPDAGRYLFVQRTALLRFPDVIQLDFVALSPGSATLCLYSRSVYGHSDLGANQRRVEDWLARIGL